jgi:hypothetical protein
MPGGSSAPYNLGKHAAHSLRTTCLLLFVMQTPLLEVYGSNRTFRSGQSKPYLQWLRMPAAGM